MSTYFNVGVEIDLLSNVLLSEDAQFAAVNWGIEDHSTTLRETYWLVKALKDLVQRKKSPFGALAAIGAAAAGAGGPPPPKPIPVPGFASPAAGGPGKE